MILRLIVGLLWCLLHLIISFVQTWSHLVELVECWVISCGLLPRYKNVQLNKLRYLAVVVDSEEAKDTTKIKKLLCWLSVVGVKYVALYDIEGVLKQSHEIRMMSSKNPTAEKPLSDVAKKDLGSTSFHNGMNIDLLSSSDDKDGIAKAANFLCSRNVIIATDAQDKIEPSFTEADIDSALKAVGCGGPEPDLLLVYGPARCHEGFPVWRLRYTEIVHMGYLKFMKYGAILKAFYEFSTKRQNYGK